MAQLFSLDESVSPMKDCTIKDWTELVCIVIATAILIIEKKEMLMAFFTPPSKRQTVTPATQTTTSATKVRRKLRFSAESFVMVLIFAVSLLRLIGSLSDTSPISRASAFWISVSTGVVLICSVYWVIRLVQYVIAVRFYREHPEFRV